MQVLRHVRRTTRPIVAATVAAGLLVTANTGLALAAPPAQGHDRVVNPVPAASTPKVSDGAVKSIVQIGNRMVAGGTFTSVTSPRSTSVLARPNVMAFDATSGVVDPNFVPVVDGEVKVVLPGPTASTVYLGGRFTNVNGVRSKSLELVDVATGASVPGFTVPALDGIVRDLRLANGRLYVAGTFTVANGAPHSGLLAVNPTTGAVDPFVNLQFTGHHNYPHNGTAFAPVGLDKIDVTPNGDRMVAIGNFTSVSGQTRDQIAMISLSGATAAVDTNWATSWYADRCFSDAYDSHVRGLQLSPDGSYFVVATTGGYIASSFNSCDTTARWETAATGSNLQPTWSTHTGGDSQYAVAVTGTAIYVGGHSRWDNNPYGSDFAGPGAVPRPGIVALDPVNGLPLAWNPGRERGHGVEALYATPAGLWMGSDTTYVGPRTYYRYRVAFFPLTGGAVIPAPTTGSLPGTVKLAGVAGSTPSTVASRSFDGTKAGPTTTTDSGIDWSQVRGAVMINGTLFYGSSDGNLYKRSYDGTTFGPATLIDPYNDPVWSNVQAGPDQTYRGVKPSFYGQLPNVTGMFFSKGRLYYTLANDPKLFSRAFTPDSGIVGAREQVSDTTMNWGDAGGMFLDGTRLYVAGRSNGQLRRVTFADGAPSAATSTVVSGPSVDGTDWRAQAVFLSTVPPASK